MWVFERDASSDKAWKDKVYLVGFHVGNQFHPQLRAVTLEAAIYTVSALNGGAVLNTLWSIIQPLE